MILVVICSCEQTDLSVSSSIIRVPMSKRCGFFFFLGGGGVVFFLMTG